MVARSIRDRWRAARSGRASRSVETVIARVHEPGATTWATFSGSAVDRVIRSAWPHHGSRTAVLVGDDLDARAVQALRALRLRLGVSAIDRADGTCHTAAGAVIEAAVGMQRLTGSDLVRADGILVIANAPFADRRASADLLTARALGIPILTLTNHAGDTAAADTHAEEVPCAPYGVTKMVQSVIRALLARSAVDRRFINERTIGFAEFLTDLESTPDTSAVPNALVTRICNFVERAPDLVMMWEPTTATSDALLARMLVGLLLSRGAVGEPGTGL
ncbi:MAG: hypothetical protein ACOYN3_08510, partial [Acidimicrobiia bacterium]